MSTAADFVRIGTRLPTLTLLSSSQDRNLFKLSAPKRNLRSQKPALKRHPFGESRKALAIRAEGSLDLRCQPNLRSRDVSRKAFYAVRRGYRPGVYDHLETALTQTRGFSNNDWRKFKKLDQAQEYVYGEVGSEACGDEDPYEEEESDQDSSDDFYPDEESSPYPLDGDSEYLLVWLSMLGRPGHGSKKIFAPDN